MQIVATRDQHQVKQMKEKQSESNGWTKENPRPEMGRENAKEVVNLCQVEEKGQRECPEGFLLMTKRQTFRQTMEEAKEGTLEKQISSL